MALKVELKPNERIVIGNAVIRNGDTRSRLFIEGNTPIMREKDILTANLADSPAKQIYFVLQLMYLDNNIDRHMNNYVTLIEEFMTDAPSAWPHINAINGFVLKGNIYKAMKSSKKLIEFEAELFTHELRDERLHEGITDGAESATG